MERKDKLKFIVKYYFKKKDYEPDEREFKLLFKSFKNEADKVLRLGKHSDKIKKKIDQTKEWAESRGLDWSLGTVVKKWCDNLKPKEEKKKPYYNGMRMYKKGDTWFVMPNDGGEHMEFAGSKDDIEWK